MPEDWDARKRGVDCWFCGNQVGDPFYVGTAGNAHLERHAIARGHAIVVFRDRHVADFTSLTTAEVAAYSAAGSEGREWRAYLSASAVDAQPEAHARERIGLGPWFNARGVQVAADIDDLHGPSNELGARTSLDEAGQAVAGGIHDILTGSNPDGTLAGDGATCRNWTSASPNDQAMLGHHNKRGGGERPDSWNAAHLSQGCDLPSLAATAGDARFYCFAAD